MSRLQQTQASCGPNALSNGCKGLHLNISEEETTKWVHKVKKDNVGADGVTEDVMLRAITEGAPKKLCLHARSVLIPDRAIALAALRGLLEDGAVAILAVDLDSHWISAVARNGGRFFVADGGATDGEVDKVYTPEELAARWENPGDGSGFFMIIMWVQPWQRSRSGS